MVSARHAEDEGADEELVYYDGGRVPGGNGAHEADTTSSHTNGNGNGRALPLSTTGIAGAHPHRSYDEEKAAFMDGLLRGDNGAGGGGGGGGEEENRWLLDNAPPGAFSRERTVRLTPAVVLGTTVAAALMLLAYAAGNSHCEPDRLGRGCGTLRWAAVQIRRKVPTLEKGSLARPAGSKCNDLVGIDRVALMFLSVEALAQDAVWALWLEQASGLVPVQPLQDEGCSANVLQRACAVRPEASPRDRQFLFSFYSHTRPNYTGHAKDSVVYQRIITPRIETVWGSPNTSIAERRMLREALKEPRNQRFLLLSDTGVPLYPPTVVWQQLMSETKSRIDACSHSVPWEWNNGLADGNNASIGSFRLSSQFWGLIRPHAELAATEKKVFAAFQKHCISHWVPELDKWYQCYTDEHYFATVLATYGRERETDCLGHSVAADWSVHSSHPHSYQPAEVNATLLHGLRQETRHGMWWPEVNASAPPPPPPVQRPCKPDQAIRLASLGFVFAANVTDERCVAIVDDSLLTHYRWRTRYLPYVCPLVARKFDFETSSVVLNMLTQDDGGLGIIKPPNKQFPSGIRFREGPAVAWQQQPQGTAAVPQTEPGAAALPAASQDNIPVAAEHQQPAVSEQPLAVAAEPGTTAASEQPQTAASEQPLAAAVEPGTIAAEQQQTAGAQSETAAAAEQASEGQPLTAMTPQESEAEAGLPSAVTPQPGSTVAEQSSLVTPQSQAVEATAQPAAEQPQSVDAAPGATAGAQQLGDEQPSAAMTAQQGDPQGGLPSEVLPEQGSTAAEQSSAVMPQQQADPASTQPTIEQPSAVLPGEGADVAVQQPAAEQSSGETPQQGTVAAAGGSGLLATPQQGGPAADQQPTELPSAVAAEQGAPQADQLPAGVLP